MTVSNRISILIPIRAQSLEYCLDRLRLRDQFDLNGISVTLTDDGSPQDVGEALQAFCADRGWQYQRLETGDAPFSLARARNAGLANATTEWVFFDDLDMVYPRHFFTGIVNECALLSSSPFSFLSLPAVYLQETISKLIFVTGSIDQYVPQILSRLVLENPRGGPGNEMIESFAPASAILLMRKKTALSIGGYDESFSGWGGEDRDFIFRLLRANHELPRPVDFSATRRWNLNDTHSLAGWRSLFRLHGDYLARKGIYAFHLHHPPNEWRSQTGRTNIERAAKMAVTLDEGQAGDVEETPAQLALRQSLLFSVYSGAASSPPNARNTAQDRSRLATMAARWRKLKRDPHAYFRDSRSPLIRHLSRFFTERENEAGSG